MQVFTVVLEPSFLFSFLSFPFPLPFLPSLGPFLSSYFFVNSSKLFVYYKKFLGYERGAG